MQEGDVVISKAFDGTIRAVGKIRDYGIEVKHKIIKMAQFELLAGENAAQFIDHLAGGLVSA